MSKALPKWTDERTQQLLEAVAGAESPIPYSLVEELAETLETSPRSVSSKLRKEGQDVQSASVARTKSFSDEQEAALRDFVESNSGEFTYAEIAEQLNFDGKDAKSIQGKVLSMELTSHVKPTPKKEAVKQYSEEEEDRILELWTSGSSLEQIAEVLGREINSIRGKCLSMRDRVPEGTAMPAQENKVSTEKADPFESLDVGNMTVEEIAEAIEKTPRGVKVMLTRRGVDCEDYKGALKRQKADAKKAA